MNTTNKKSIVLLITMLFISGISLLILDNLKDNDQFINSTKITPSLVQINISIKNINKEIYKLFNKIDKNDIDEITQQIPPTLPYGDIVVSNILVKTLDFTNKYDMNKDYTQTNDMNLIENINFLYDFNEITKNNKTTNNRQKDYLINKYIKLTQDEKIINIKDDFVVNLVDYNLSKKYISCSYDLEVENITTHIDYIFEHKGKDQYFDFYFKSIK